METPTTVKKFIATAKQAGFATEIEHRNDGEWTQGFDDGSQTDFKNVPVVLVTLTHKDVGVMAGWIKNPVTNRWCLTAQKPLIVREKRKDEYANEVERRVNEALGFGLTQYEAWSLKWLNGLIGGGADNFREKVNQWK